MKEYIFARLNEAKEAVHDVKVIGELIRCKDCKFSMSGIDKNSERYILCQLHERSYGVIDDGFCNWSERKNDETD